MRAGEARWPVGQPVLRQRHTRQSDGSPLALSLSPSSLSSPPPLLPSPPLSSPLPLSNTYLSIYPHQYSYLLQAPSPAAPTHPISAHHTPAMQRPIYPAKTPPLHHPVPQKPVQVPVMHSPPPPPSSSNSYNSPYDNPSYSQPRGGAGPTLHPDSAFNYQTWGGPSNAAFLNDPAAAMGISVAKAAMFSGGDYAEKNVPPTPPSFPPPTGTPPTGTPPTDTPSSTATSPRSNPTSQ